MSKSKIPVPANEAERLKALDSYGILDALPDKDLDAITRLASYVCNTSVSLITLIDDHRQWFLSKHGDIDKSETARDISFCQHAIMGDDIYEVPDAANNELFSDNELVVGSPYIRYYAGAPLITPDGHKLGTLCVIDTVPGSLTIEQREALRTLAGEVVSHLELRRKNKELEKNAIRFQEFYNMFNVSPDMHCILDGEGHILFVNEAVNGILGFTVEFALGKVMWDFCHEEDRQRIINILDESRSKGQTQLELDFRIISPSGELKWISWLAVNRNNNWYAYGRDISEQRRIAAALEKLSFVASKIDNGVVISDANNNVTWVNNAFEKITGYRIDDVKGQLLGDVLKGEDTDYTKIEEARKLTKNKQSFTLDMLAYRKDGSAIWLSVYNTVVLNDTGEINAQVEILVDITERKKVEDQLHLLSLVASKTSNGVIIADSKGRCVWVNEAMEDIMGYSLAEVEGQLLGDVLSGEDTDRTGLMESRKRSLQGKSHYFEILGYRKDKTTRWLSVSNTPVINKEGNLERLISIVNDITERKDAEKELIIAREQALQLSETKEMFLSVMSHEIRTPLNAIIGITHLLQEDDPKPSQLDNINILKFSAGNLLNLINDILDFTKIETGNLTLERIPFDIADLARETVGSLKVNAAKKGLKLVADIDDQIPQALSGDRTRLYQVLVNLIGNAIKFTNTGEIRLKLELLQQTATFADVYFEISDTGIGIAKDKQDYVFESFTQAQADTTRKYGGTGLGLAITKKLIELHNARIFVESDEGKGARFYFTIRFDKEENDGEEPMLIKPVEGEHNSGAIVLVVEDNEVNALIVRKMLSKWGIQVDFATHGKMAVEMVQEKKYDLVLMDINMPIMNGFEATKAIRALPDNEYYQSLPIIALTASTIDSDIERFKKSGMDDHVLKPFNPQALKLMIEKYIHH